jgi:hypothetical protein
MAYANQDREKMPVVNQLTEKLRRSRRYLRSYRSGRSKLQLNAPSAERPF